MRQVAAIALGSNLDSQWGDRQANLREAVKRVGQLGQMRAVSSFYDTAPVGYTEQPRFLNGAMLLETDLQPVELMRELLAIERAMGRDRAAVAAGMAPGMVSVKGPRVIDLDLLLMGETVLSCGELELPHPAMTGRRFVLEPLAEIAPAMVDPRSGRTAQEILARLDNP